MRPPTFALGSRAIGEGQPCFVLAEVASAHGGEADRALKMLESAFKMGADGIKFQLFRRPLVVRRHPAARTSTRSSSARRSGAGPARGQGFGPHGAGGPFDVPSCAWPRTRAGRLQVHSTDMENPEFIRAVGGRGARDVRDRRVETR